MDDSTRDSALNGQCLGQGAVKRGGAFGQAAGQEPSCRTGRQTGEKPFVSILDRSGALEQSAGQEMIPRAVCWTGAERSNRGLDRRRALGQFAGNWTGAEPSDNMLDRSGALGSQLYTVKNGKDCSSNKCTRLKNSKTEKLQYFVGVINNENSKKYSKIN